MDSFILGFVDLGLLYGSHTYQTMLSHLCRDSAPGQKECTEAIDQVNNSIRDLDQASLAAISQNLAPRNERSLRVCTVKSDSDTVV